MNLYPNNISSIIGFDEIKAILADFSQTHYAKNRSLTLVPSSKKQTVEHTLQQVSEVQRVMKSFAMPELVVIDEIRTELKETIKLGSIPQTSLLFKIKKILLDTSLLFSFFDDIKTSFPTLSHTIQPVTIPQILFEFLNKILDEEGNITPDSSPELKRISVGIILKEKEIRKLLNNRFDVAKKNGWAGDTEITIRNDRLVIPIIAEYKKKIKGFVHDDSASGKFLYIEPIECFEENNRLRELYLSRKKEIERILRHAGALLTDSMNDIELLLGMWERLDFYRAKAKLNNLLGGNFPEFAEQPLLNLQNAIHPLLLLNARKEDNQDTLVKNSVLLNKEHSVMLISGPNAGGKSVLLKTAVLLQVMFQSGLGITASPTSEMYVFEKIFAEFSDNQSIENALSTYSAHLVHMKYILENADSKTFLTIDELGSGTDPELASPIAEAMLEMLCKTKASGIISSHLGNLKKLPEHTPNLINASMQYDPVHLKPLYRLVVGRPGSSFAFELAQSLKLPGDLLNNIRLKMKESKTLEYEELNLRIEKLSYELEEAQKKVAQKGAHLDKLLKEYETLKKQLQESKNLILKSAREKASETLMEANLLLKKIKKTDSKKGLEKHEISNFNKQINKLSEQIKKGEKNQGKVTEQKVNEEIIPDAVLSIGDFVKLKDSEQIGEIVEINKNKATILLGELRSTIDIKRLNKLKNQSKAKKETQKSVSHYSNEIMEKQSSFSHTLDLRGERADVALLKVEKWLDDAYLIGAFHLKILHGKGEGILKKFIIDFLKTNPHVKEWKFEHEDRGGEGATLVELI
ncbi:MAG: Smr/MutS family protein [Bacteroidetes bacterium]|nr:Smr/MutS family protein [Bacteroidota bacterium]